MINSKIYLKKIKKYILYTFITQKSNEILVTNTIYISNSMSYVNDS